MTRNHSIEEDESVTVILELSWPDQLLINSWRVNLRFSLSKKSLNRKRQIEMWPWSSGFSGLISHSLIIEKWISGFPGLRSHSIEKRWKRDCDPWVFLVRSATHWNVILRNFIPEKSLINVNPENFIPEKSLTNMNPENFILEKPLTTNGKLTPSFLGIQT